MTERAPAPDPAAPGDAAEAAAPGDAAEAAALASAVRAGDAAAFTRVVEHHRRELHVHCYRMTGSFDQAEDLVQDTFLRAWRRRTGFEGRASVRTWLYRIATNACLDALAHSRRRRLPHQVSPANVPLDDLPPVTDVEWLQPYPDRLLDGTAGDPSAAVIDREALELGFLATIQLLPARQRAVLILREVLGWSAGDTAAQLDTSVAGVNSALQRARATLARHRPASREDWRPGAPPRDGDLALLRRYMDAFERADVAAVAAMLRDDAVATMPPHPWWFAGREHIVAALADSLGRGTPGPLRCRLTSANGRPAVASWQGGAADGVFRPFVLGVLRIEDGLIAEMTAFDDDGRMFARFGLPATVDAGLGRFRIRS